MCELAEPSFPKIYNRLGFFDFETTACPTSGKHIANVCSLMYENKTYGQFDLVTFCDPALNYQSNGIPRKNVFCKEYMPNPTQPCFKKLAERFFKKENPSSDMDISENSTDNNLERNTDKNVIEQFLDFILRPEFYNFTFLSHAGSKVKYFINWLKTVYLGIVL